MPMQAGESEPWRLLYWDTNLFGIRIASILKPLSEVELQAYLIWAQAHDIECTYYECPIEQIEAIQLAHQYGFQFVDIRVLLQRSMKIPFQANTHEMNIRSAQVFDFDKLKALSIQLHTETRFFADHRFPQAQARELYAIWMRNECLAPDGIVWVKTDENDSPIGYLTCKAQGDLGTIGLFGVASHYQGKGIGQSLLRKGLSWFHEKQCNRVQVVTQGKNTGALASYCMQQFIIIKQSVWLHRWTHATSRS
jgi:ribosomal protein S18 acetylase RimI-like enzyme